MQELDIPESFHLIESRHKTFVANVCKNQVVYTLNSEEGFAFGETIFIDDEEGNFYDKMLFWSTKAEAKLCKIEDWQEHEIEAINLSNFLEQWCLSLKGDNCFIGTEPTPDMVSYEIDPLHLIIEIIEELKRGNSSLNLSKFDSIFDLEQQVKQALEG